MNKVDAEKVILILLEAPELLNEFCHTFPTHKKLALELYKEDYGNLFETEEQWKNFVYSSINIKMEESM